MKTNLLKAATGFVLFVIPLLNWAQAPNLGTLSAFGLFTKNGAINIVGASDVTGNVGTDIGALTGFPPGTIVGTIQVANATSAQAAVDVVAAYDDLTAVGPCGTVLDYVIPLGSGQILTPGVYCLGSASSLIGNLFLDGGGDPNALFIFKINGAFSTAAASNLILINSAFYYNVYWQIIGAVEFGANSVFEGSLIADGAISFMNNSYLLGRALSITGAISLDASVVDIGSGNPVPIELISFTANCNNELVIISWSTASEINNDYFNLESSATGDDWKIIAKVDGAGNSVTVKHYEFIDKEPHSEVLYYRLKQTDFDGNFETHRVISVIICKDADMVITVFPNPAHATLNLDFNGKNKQVRLIEIFNAAGTKVFQGDGGQTTIDISNHPEGLHFVVVHLATRVITKKFLLLK